MTAPKEYTREVRTFSGVNNDGDSFTAVLVVGNKHTKGNNKGWQVTFTATGSTRTATLANMKAGKVKDLYKPSRYGVGYTGEIVRPPECWKRVRDLWSNMLRRCYGGYARCYEDATVCPRWHNFSVFLQDVQYLPGFPEWERGECYDLDKDLLVTGNKVYAPAHCAFVPRGINRAAGKGGKTMMDGQWVRPLA